MKAEYHQRGSARSILRLAAWTLAAGLVASVAAVGLGGGVESPWPFERLRARVHLKQGNRSYLAGRYDDAVRSYDQALGLAPDLVTAWLNRAYSLEALSRAAEGESQRLRLAEGAVAAYERVLELCGDEAGRGARERVIALLIATGRLERAAAHLQVRLAQDRHDLAALELLGRLELERGRPVAALERRRQRVAAAPDDPNGLAGLGAFVWWMTRHGQSEGATEGADSEALLQEGLEALQRALELRPDDVSAVAYADLICSDLAVRAPDAAARAVYEAQAGAYQARALKLGAAAADTSRLADR